jgi:hypothetical protein
VAAALRWSIPDPHRRLTYELASNRLDNTLIRADPVDVQTTHAFIGGSVECSITMRITDDSAYRFVILDEEGSVIRFFTDEMLRAFTFDEDGNLQKA